VTVRFVRRSALLLPAAVIASAALACGGAAEATPEAVAVADTALLSAETVEIGQFALAAVSEGEWRDAWPCRRV
jgi:hypothetical protein